MGARCGTDTRPPRPGARLPVTSPLRVLHVLEALGGGTSRHLIDVVTYATQTDHIVAVPSRRVGGLSDDTAITNFKGAGAGICTLEMRRTPWSPRNAAAVLHLKRLIRAERPDIVHAHSSIGGLVARLGTWGSGIPTIYTPNGITQVRAGILVERLLRRRTAKLIAVSSSEADVARRLRVADEHHLVVIPNGIALEVPAPGADLRDMLGITPETPLVGTVSRLVPQKAPEDFVAACAQVARAVPDTHFVLIGTGELEARVDAAVDKADLRARFHHISVLPEAASVLGQLDVFALSSRFEGGPYAPLEAMRAGVPVVLTAVAGSIDVVEHDVSGILVRPGAPEELAQAVTELLLDPVRRARLGAAGQHRVATHFDVRDMAAALDELYHLVASKPL